MSGFFDPFGNSSGGGGGTSSKDEVARAEIAAIKDGETLDSFSDVETALADKADITDIPTVPITDIQKNGIDIAPVSGTVNIIVPTTAADVSALPDTTKYASALSLTINSQTFVITGQLKDQNGNNLGTAQTIDLPLESVVVGGSYNSQTKKVVLTLQNGNTVEFSVADLVSGLQTELSASNKLNPAYINYDSIHRAVSDTEKSIWNGKQNAIDGTHKLSSDLVDDENATHKFATAAQLEQIETNKNNISLLETKANTNASILSQTYNSADCNMSIYLCQDNGAIDESTYYIADQSKMNFRVHYWGRLVRYWKDGVDYQKFRWSSVGLIATNNSAKKNMLTLDIPEVANETYVKIYHPTDDDPMDDPDGAFTWRKSQSNVGDIWYIRPHIEYTDLETGMEYTMYGAVYKVTVGTPCTIECDTLSCTELTQIVGDINSVLEEVL